MPKTGVGSIDAFDLPTGEPKWSVPLAAIKFVAADGVVYVLVRGEDPKADKNVVALDLKTGKQRWRLPVSSISENPDIDMDVPVRVCLDMHAQQVQAGALGRHPFRGRWPCVVEDEDPQHLASPDRRPGLQNLKRFDPRTGEEKGQSAIGYLAGRTCQSTAMSAHCIFVPCWFWFMGLAAEDDHKAKLTPFEYYGIRGACGEGAIPANGMLYLAQHNCKCVPGDVRFSGRGAVGGVAEPEEFERARPVEKGPAFGTLDSRAVGPDDWPVYRHDAQRSALTAASSGQVEAALEIAGRAVPTAARDGVEAQLTLRPTPPSSRREESSRPQRMKAGWSCLTRRPARSSGRFRSVPASTPRRRSGADCALSAVTTDTSMRFARKTVSSPGASASPPGKAASSRSAPLSRSAGGRERPGRQ